MSAMMPSNAEHVLYDTRRKGSESCNLNIVTMGKSSRPIEFVNFLIRYHLPKLETYKIVAIPFLSTASLRSSVVRLPQLFSSLPPILH